MASQSKGGISEWLEMQTDEFILWMNDLKELNKRVGK